MSDHTYYSQFSKAADHNPLAHWHLKDVIRLYEGNCTTGGFLFWEQGVGAIALQNRPISGGFGQFDYGALPSSYSYDPLCSWARYPALSGDAVALTCLSIASVQGPHRAVYRWHLHNQTSYPVAASIALFTPSSHSLCAHINRALLNGLVLGQTGLKGTQTVITQCGGAFTRMVRFDGEADGADLWTSFSDSGYLLDQPIRPISHPFASVAGRVVLAPYQVKVVQFSICRDIVDTVANTA